MRELASTLVYLVYRLVNVTGPLKFVRNNIADSALVKDSENFASRIGGQVECDDLVDVSGFRVLARFVFWGLSRFCRIFISAFQRLALRQVW